MVLDSLTVAEKYYALHPRFQEAFEFIKGQGHKLSPGKYIIDGEELFVSVVKGPLKQKSNAWLEAHNEYIDIQLLLSGSESYGWKSRTTCQKIKTAYDIEKDILFFQDTPSSYFELCSGEFVVFFPEDAHAPMIGEGEVVKAIIKVRV